MSAIRGDRHRHVIAVIRTERRKHGTDVTADFASDEFARVMNLKVLSGRWFRPEDEAADFLPMVMDADAAKARAGKVPP